MVIPANSAMHHPRERAIAARKYVFSSCIQSLDAHNVSTEATAGRSEEGLTAVNLNFIESFFAQYPAFDYCKEDPIVEEFCQMCDYFGWDREGGEKKAAQFVFKTAMILTFNALYGTDINDIRAWHKLCVALDIVPLPNGLKACRNVSCLLVDSSGHRG